MSTRKECTECQTTESSKFRSVNGKKWREAKSQNLVKVTWVEGVVLCNTCYMRFVENPLKRGTKQVKVTTEEETEATIEEEVSSKIDLTKAIKFMAKILYDREHVKKEGPIYGFDEMRELLQESEPSLKDFFNQLYSAARPRERNEQTMDRMKRLMVFICYFLASLNNTKITVFKFDLAYYLDSVGTSNEGLNTMVDRRKKKYQIHMENM